MAGVAEPLACMHPPNAKDRGPVPALQEINLAVGELRSAWPGLVSLRGGEGLKKIDKIIQLGLDGSLVPG